VMTLRQRLATAWAHLLGKAAPRRWFTSVAVPRLGRHPAAWADDPEEQVRHYAHWVYAAVRAISGRIAGTDLDVFVRRGDEVEELTDPAHPLLRLLDEVNPFQTHYGLWESTVMFLELTGNAYWYLADNRLGVPAEIWLIPSQKVRVVPHPKRFIEGYVVRHEGSEVRLDAREVIHLKYPNPRSPYYGRGPLQAAAASVDTHEKLKRAEWSAFDHGLLTDLALETDQRLSEAVVERLREQVRRKYAGPENAGRPLILEAGLKANRIALTPREMNFLQTRRDPGHLRRAGGHRRAQRGRQPRRGRGHGRHLRALLHRAETAPHRGPTQPGPRAPLRRAALLPIPLARARRPRPGTRRYGGQPAPRRHHRQRGAAPARPARGALGRATAPALQYRAPARDPRSEGEPLMSEKTFDLWLRELGADRRDGRYYLPCRGKAGRGDSEDALSVVISTPARDRHGDILEPAGLDAAAFRRNPVVLWAHRYDDLPIGKAVNIGAADGAVTAEVVFDRRPFAREVLRLYREGFLAGWSVGFLPREWEALQDEEGRFAGYHVTRWELLELSAVPVPANPEALTRELAGGRIQAPALRKALGEALAPAAAPHAATRPTAAPRAEGRPDRADHHSPPAAVERLADALIPRLLRGLRAWAEQAALREIRRWQGKVD